MLEALEERRLPSLFTVTNLHNAGAGSLRSAIRQANTAAGADTIQFAAGLTGTVRLTGGELAITDKVSVLGPGAGVLKISGNHVSRVFTVAAGVRANLANLAITEGIAPGVSVSTAGGAILNNGILWLKNVVLTDNACRIGGAVASIGAGSWLTIIRSKLANNASEFAGGAGGAIYNGVHSTALIRNSTIIANHGLNGSGAGIYNFAMMTIVSSTIARNTGLGGFAGGGIANGGSLTILASTIAGNFSQGAGGGIYNAGALTIISSTITNNTALGSTGGGGIRAISANLSISNSTITGNVDASGAAATRAGGISFDAESGSLTLNNTVVAENFVTSGGPPDIRSMATSGSGNFIGAGNGFLVGIANGTNGNRVGTVAAPLDPKLGPLRNNGGPTLTRLPRPGSPLVNAGFNALVPTGMTADQRGFRRIKFGVVDIGAVEFGATQ
jgi:hypothetical protein